MTVRDIITQKREMAVWYKKIHFYSGPNTSSANKGGQQSACTKFPFWELNCWILSERNQYFQVLSSRLNLFPNFILLTSEISTYFSLCSTTMNLKKHTIITFQHQPLKLLLPLFPLSIICSAHFSEKNLHRTLVRPCLTPALHSSVSYY